MKTFFAVLIILVIGLTIGACGNGLPASAIDNEPDTSTPDPDWLAVTLYTPIVNGPAPLSLSLELEVSRGAADIAELWCEYGSGYGEPVYPPVVPYQELPLLFEQPGEVTFSCYARDVTGGTAGAFVFISIQD